MQHKKIIYVPGLISLLGFPLLLLIMGPEDPRPRATCIRMFVPRDKPYDSSLLSFDAQQVYTEAAKKKINNIEFRKFDWEYEISRYRQASKLDFVQKEIQRLAVLRDTSAILKIELANAIDYGELVWILDEINLQGLKRYALIDYSLIIFPNELPPRPGQGEEVIPLFLENDIIPVEPEPLPWLDQFLLDIENQLEIFYGYIKHNYLLISGFLLFIVIPFFSRIKKYISLLNTTNRVYHCVN